MSITIISTLIFDVTKQMAPNADKVTEESKAVDHKWPSDYNLQYKVREHHRTTFRNKNGYILGLQWMFSQEQAKARHPKSGLVRP